MLGPSCAGSMPSTRSSPSVTGDTHPIIRIVDVLPAPFGPRNPNASPGSTAKSMPSTATNDPNRLVRRRPSTCRCDDTTSDATDRFDPGRRPVLRGGHWRAEKPFVQERGQRDR